MRANMTDSTVVDYLLITNNAPSRMLAPVEPVYKVPAPNSQARIRIGCGFYLGVHYFVFVNAAEKRNHRTKICI